MFKYSIKMFLWLALITGGAYPLLITLISQAIMPFQANGSFIVSQGKTIGSQLIGQKFQSERYFWGRPSAVDYNPQLSGGSNLGPISTVLKKQVEKRTSDLLKANPSSNHVPSDLVYASGSGFDPHITIEAALFQKERIVKARGFNEIAVEHLNALISQKIVQRKFGLLGPRYLNVLELNLALDELQEKL